jgi:transposase
MISSHRIVSCSSARRLPTQRPTYCPHLDPIERLWGLMHKHVTHNRCHATFADFKAAVLTFLREEVPRKPGNG